MKKLTLFFAMVSFALFANAQSLNVSSAIQDLKKGYLSKAKTAIDAACNHESTKDDAKTWCYAGLVYSRIGGEASNPKSKFKDLDPNWCEKALNAANRCKELDKDNEFAAQNNEVFRFVGNDVYSRAVSAFNDEKNYAKSMELAEQAIKIFNNSGDKKFANDAYYLAGLCAKVTQDNDNLKKYFKALVRSKYDKEDVYRTLFNIYKDEKNNEEAVKVANNYNKAFPNDYHSDLLLAEAYLLNGNIEKGKEMLNGALEKTKDKPEVYAQLLGAVAGILDNNKDFEGAEAKYQESLRLVPNQYAANYGMGSMLFNRGVDKIDAANAVPLDDETGLSDKLVEESKVFFGQSVQYFQAAINYIDGLPQNARDSQRKNLYNCFNALKTVYARLERYDDLKPINTRIEQLQSQQ